MSISKTPGGKRLRALREFYGKTQLEVELDASLGIGYLQRLELGRVQQPERDTLERILAALQARFTERREVLELFGYIVHAELPTHEEVEWAISVCRDELDNAVFPVYLLDCTHRLLYWNRIVPNLFAPAVMESLRQVSALRLVFDPAYGMTPRIINGDVLFPAQIRALRYEMQRFPDEPWYIDLLADMLQCETFAYHWELEQRETIHIPARPLSLMQLAVGEHVLSFRLMAEAFIQDHRFRVVYYLPADALTSQQCMVWVDQTETT